MVSGSLHYDHRLEIPLLPEDSSCSLTKVVERPRAVHDPVRDGDRSWHFIHVRSAPTIVRSPLAVRSVYATNGRIEISARCGQTQCWKRAVCTAPVQRYHRRSRRNSKCHKIRHGNTSGAPAGKSIWHQASPPSLLDAPAKRSNAKVERRAAALPRAVYSRRVRSNDS